MKLEENRNDIPTQTTNAILNAKANLELLKEWLSISELQLCSTEVLSEQLPVINKLLEDSMNDISRHFVKLSENSSEIEIQVNEANAALDIIKNGRKDVEIPAYLQQIAADTTDPETAKSLQSLAKKITKQESDIHAKLDKAVVAIKENSSEIGKIIVGMQFQDRVSQNIMIAINIMQAVVSYLDKEIEHSLPNVSKEERKKMLNIDFAKEVLQTFRLGELQLSFVNHLLEHGYIKDASDIGFDISAHDKADDDDDVDLF